MPLVGSSNTMNRGSPTNASATFKARRLPADKDPAGVPVANAPERATSFKRPAADPEPPLQPRSAAASRRCSAAVRSSKSTSCWGHTPRCRRASLAWVVTSAPLMVILPSVGLTAPVSILTVVDFPAPLCPNKAKISPSGSPKSNRRTATTRRRPSQRYSLRTWLNSTAQAKGKESSTIPVAPCGTRRRVERRVGLALGDPSPLEPAALDARAQGRYHG
mmetsp:Transcript_17547/g.61343  ORF Transcript_17547/g.61343 Transcript_17547/m.61343 type:complete len:219 (+) Transcript_17547:574-1230(+)